MTAMIMWRDTTIVLVSWENVRDGNIYPHHRGIIAAALPVGSSGLGICVEERGICDNFEMADVCSEKVVERN
eukprot:CAMPEP_0116024204 /NCGR_PEP_ID=MMETSP0321-20121206/12160_1 /TAXON_ID=163516 /ORGANISM="Leptocylindrus danicus var. danicus, Strain B650" /LENGTH=71 /DNA_ID=CAMNT_0003495855 /DNA_START=448 /DNA_END=660 /DNA_ORIENTATION=-